jgi:hypothetical protein
MPVNIASNAMLIRRLSAASIELREPCFGWGPNENPRE